MRVIKELLGGILRPMKDLANRLDRTEYEIGNATIWLLTRATKGELPSISDDQAGLLVEFALQIDRFGGRLPIRLETVYTTGWFATGTVLKNRHIAVVYDYPFRHPRFLKFSGPGDDGRENIVTAVFAKNAEELQEFFSTDPGATAGRLRYYPTTNMLVGLSQGDRPNETYRMIAAPYTPRGHESMHVWVRADTI